MCISVQSAFVGVQRFRLCFRLKGRGYSLKRTRMPFVVAYGFGEKNVPYSSVGVCRSVNQVVRRVSLFVLLFSNRSRLSALRNISKRTGTVVFPLISLTAFRTQYKTSPTIRLGRPQQKRFGYLSSVWAADP